MEILWNQPNRSLKLDWCRNEWMVAAHLNWNSFRRNKIFHENWLLKPTETFKMVSNKIVASKVVSATECIKRMFFFLFLDCISPRVLDSTEKIKMTFSSRLLWNWILYERYSQTLSGHMNRMIVIIMEYINLNFV